jgi:predicted acylesterase/phospholipase RssA
MARRRFQILALSGGGYRGLHVARVLELIEQRIDTRIATHFDLIAGTSVGGIIALALGLHIPAATIRQVLEDVGPALFPSSPPTFASLKEVAAAPGLWSKLRRAASLRKDIARDIQASRAAWYDPQPLKAHLSQANYFGDRKMGDLLHPVIVPAVNYSDGQPKFFKTDHHPSLTFDRDLTLLDVALGTSAAPIYFPAHRVQDWRIVDGGLVANDPTQVAVHEALKFFHVRPALYGDEDPAADDVRVLSIGTLSPRRFADPKRPLNQGLFDWGAGAFELAMSAQEAMSAVMVDKHMLPGKVIRLPSIEERPESAPGLADASPISAEILRASAIKLAQSAFGREDFTRLFSHTAQTLAEVREQPARQVA